MITGQTALFPGSAPPADRNPMAGTDSADCRYKIDKFHSIRGDLHASLARLGIEKQDFHHDGQHGQRGI
ncbi:hypothetical protein ABH909_003706 [Pseudomonas sp. BS3782 TE3695]